MSNLLNKETFSRLGERVKNNYNNANKFQKVALFTGVGVAGAILISLSFGSGRVNHHKIKDYPVQFETTAKPMVSPTLSKGINSIQSPAKSNIDLTPLQNQLNQVKESSDQEFNALKDQLSVMQSNMSGLASQNDLQQLQDTITQPNPTLLGKVDTLQTSVQKIIQQTAKVKFVNPKEVEKYFKLVAVQGFSDGMKVIVDVNGNQTALSLNEDCPACRGWRLKNMDFSNQSATFEKGKNIFVKLQVK